MEYANAMDARRDLELKLAGRGIVGDAVDEEIKAIAKAIPEIVRGSYDADETIAAAQYADKYYAALENGGGAPTPQTPAQPKVGGTPEVSIPAADLKAIQQFQNSTKAARNEKAAKTRIVKLIGDKPYPGDYLGKDLKMTPNSDEDKFAKYREVLVDTPENIDAYNKCMEAIKNKTLMDIYIPERSKWSPRTIGAEVSTPSDNGSGVSEKPMDMNQLIAFVAFELAGIIVNDAKTIGAKLASVRVKKSKKASASQGALAPRLNISNRKLAYATADLHTFASVPKKNGNEVLTKEGTVRSALSFQIYTGKTDKDGNKKVRTVRVSGRANVPKWERANAVYEDIFGPVEKSGDVFTALTTKEQQAMNVILSKTIYAIQNDAASFGDYSYQIEQELQKTGATPSGADADFN